MKLLSVISLALLLWACGAQKKDEAPKQDAPVNATSTAAAEGSEKVNPDSVELRISIPKASLPATMSALGNKEETARPKVAGADLAKLRTMLANFGGKNGTESTCFTVCEPECHEVGGGTGTVCYNHCHRECF